MGVGHGEWAGGGGGGEGEGVEECMRAQYLEHMYAFLHVRVKLDGVASVLAGC